MKKENRAQTKRCQKTASLESVKIGSTEQGRGQPRRSKVIFADPIEFKIVALRECPLPSEMQICDEPARCANYWRNHIQTEPMFNPDVECCIVLCLNARRRVTGHHFVSLGLIDQVLLHPREVLRAAIISSASAIVIMHNHPSGETNPSEADIVATRRIMRAGEVVSVPLLDHVIVNNTGQYTSMRASGFLVKL